LFGGINITSFSLLYCQEEFRRENKHPIITDSFSLDLGVKNQEGIYNNEKNSKMGF